jgi:hypothetical protein
LRSSGLISGLIDNISDWPKRNLRYLPLRRDQVRLENPHGSDSSHNGTQPSGVEAGIGIFDSVPGAQAYDNVVINNEVNTSAQVNVHLNDILGMRIGVDNLDQSGTVDATENWWGSPRGPGTLGATTVNGTGVVFTPWLTRPNPELR